VDLGRPVEDRAELARPGMEPPELTCLDRPVQGVPQQLVAEVVVATIEVVERVQERLLDELLDRGVEVADRPVEQARHHLGHEAPPDDRAGTRHGLGVRRQAPVAGEHGILDRVGDLRLADRAPVEVT